MKDNEQLRVDLWLRTYGEAKTKMDRAGAIRDADAFLAEFDKRFTEKPLTMEAITLRGSVLSQDQIIGALGSADAILTSVVNIVSGPGTREADALVRQAKEWLRKYT